MNKFILTLCAAVVVAAVSFAQAPGPNRGGAGDRPSGQRGGMMMSQRGIEIEKRVLAKLNLTADQKKRIDALNAKQKTEMDKIMAEVRKLRDANKPAAGKPNQNRQPDPKMRALMERMGKLIQSRRTELNKILTPAQRSQYEKLMKDEMEKMRKEREKNGQRAPSGSRTGRGPGSR